MAIIQFEQSKGDKRPLHFDFTDDLLENEVIDSFTVLGTTKRGSGLAITGRVANAENTKISCYVAADEFSVSRVTCKAVCTTQVLVLECNIVVR